MLIIYIILKNRNIYIIVYKKGSLIMNNSEKEDVSGRDEFKTVLKPIIEHFRKEHKLSQHELINLIIEPEEPLIPLSIFSTSLAPLQSIVKYLKEELNLKHKGISTLLKRDQRVVWKSYTESNKKQPKRFEIKEERYFIPVSIFGAKELSILESLALYLKESLNLSIKDISSRINKNTSTIYTAYSRAKKKQKT